MCGSCDKHIENTTNSIEGVFKAKWNDRTQMLQVEYDSGKTDLKKIERAIADAGHDTMHYKKQLKFYTDMPECCQYRQSLQNE